MIFLNNVQVTLPHIVFNTPFELIYDKRYPLHAKTKIFWFYTFSGYCLGSQIRDKKSYSQTKFKRNLLRMVVFQTYFNFSTEIFTE